jgi:Mn-dependent DtxR family transcriptional regulator
MPHALTERQKEYLQFLKDYIRENEITPRLEEVAGHFGVSLPTAHKILDALERKGFLFTRRESASGFYVRMAEREGASRN